MKLLFGSIFFIALTGTAQAYCAAPNAPSSMTLSMAVPTLPQTPHCINEYNNTHTCDDWTIDNYNRDIDRYNRSLQDFDRNLRSYRQAVESYYDSAYSYMNCLVDQLD